jgi:NADPH-dependent glutamate synthase beta subunit-like oxidoreductase
MDTFAEIIDALRTPFIGLGTTIKNFFRPPVTIQYPWEKDQLPLRSRGVLGMHDFFDAETISHRSKLYFTEEGQYNPNIAKAPCIWGCPDNVPAREYVTLSGEGEFLKALTLLKNHYPWSGVLGRICSAPCEGECNRGKVTGKTIAIRKLKRFLADYEYRLPKSDWWDYRKMQEHFTKKPTGKKIAVLGAGPAGITCAWYLAMRGHKVTIYERFPNAHGYNGGGYLFTGIPKYRLNRKVLEKEVQDVLSMEGVEIVYNAEVGINIQFEEIAQRHDAVFICVGAIKPLRLNIPGEDLEGVIPAEDYLEELNFWLEDPNYPFKLRPGKKIIIIGGGFTSMDASRSARRLGSEAILVYRRTQSEMLASLDEIEDGQEEDVKYWFLLSPIEVKGTNGHVSGFVLRQNRLGDFDRSRRRRPIEIKGSDALHECDTVMTAISREPSLRWLPSDIKLTKRGTIDVHPETLMSVSRRGVFAGGDVVLGPATVIQAVAQAKTAARAIHEYLTGEKPHEEIFDQWGVMKNKKIVVMPHVGASA